MVEGQQERIGALEAELRTVQGALHQAGVTASAEKVRLTYS